jgi:hypothetical protein
MSGGLHLPGGKITEMVTIKLATAGLFVLLAGWLAAALI